MDAPLFSSVEEAEAFLRQYPFLVYDFNIKRRQYEDQIEQSHQQVLDLQRQLEQVPSGGPQYRQIKTNLDRWKDQIAIADRQLHNLPSKAFLEYKRMEARQYIVDHKYR